MEVEVATTQSVRDFAQRCIDAGDACKMDDNGRTLLHLAAYMNDALLVKRLMAVGVKPDTPDRHGVTALDIALQYDSLDALKAMRE